MIPVVPTILKEASCFKAESIRYLQYGKSTRERLNETYETFGSLESEFCLVFCAASEVIC
jgi:hypothetical protein